ncbi:Inorganic phosphate transporter [Petrocella atlantisensis]|uniref:Inorganic phosphate transporter n=1 Tax=Petrocella atlantisensis TaxID=2173034 RepID=A0A3P7PXB5_9FIRM|nr:inorganic phosphate transporter [Petrocella atlantisensis]MCF8020702.1 inorganic phosphate transporter [Vallitaleaceae bacterium]VDN47841.1 Inorganic phosphate transporter [Petrocella atlantisensis]
MNFTMATAIFLSAGLFMGWSLGGNDAANIFGTAVGTRMVKFSTAAIICSIFVILGAVLGGTGASHTLGQLGAINAIGGSFAVSASAAFTVMVMTGKGLPVSTSQAVVGAIIGWNIFGGIKTEMAVVYKIVGTWVFTPILAALFAVIFYWIIKYMVEHTKIHIVKMDKYTRYALMIAGAFGAYSLGANNIANVMGVFINVSPFATVRISENITITSTQQLFFLGALAISLGVFTYSKKVMLTVGKSIFKLSPISAFIVVLATSTVLFLFSSESLSIWLTSRNLPAFPLVPVSQSQAVVGAIMGIGLAKGGRNINMKELGRIGSGWIMTPLISMMISLLSLYILQNVFMQTVINY